MNVLLTLLSLTAGFNTWVVDPGGGGDFSTIQAAIDASAPGDLIQITPATYVEDLLVHVSVTLEALPGGTVLIQPATSNRGTGVGSQVLTTTQSCVIRAHDVTLRGLVFDGDNPALGNGIDVRSGIITDYTSGPWDRLTVEDCEVHNIYLRAIYGSTGHDHLFQRNLVKRARGLYLESSGIMLWGATGVIRDNEIWNCSLGITNHAGSAGDIYRNEVHDCDLGVLTNGSNAPMSIYDNQFVDCEQGHQWIACRADVTVRNNQITGSRWGFSLFGSTAQITLDDNTVDGGGMPGSVGVFATTDLAPWGTNPVQGGLRRNRIEGVGTAIVLDETPASVGQPMALVLGGADGDGNTLRDFQDAALVLQNCNDPIDARFNSWGFATAPAIENQVYHQVDDPALGLVDFSSASADQVVVDAAGGADFVALQPAIDLVTVGGTVKVRAGDYPGSPVIAKSLVLDGAGSSDDPLVSTRIFGDGAVTGMGTAVVDVLATDVVLQDLWIFAWSDTLDDRYGAAVRLNAADRGTMRNLTLRRGIHGLLAQNSADLRVEDCVAQDCGLSENSGGGFVWQNCSGNLGVDGAGNTTRSGKAPGMIVQGAAASTSLVGNLIEDCPIGIKVEAALAAVEIRDNGTLRCRQGFRLQGNDADVTLTANRSVHRDSDFGGFLLYGGGVGSYQLDGNFCDGGDLALLAFYMNPNGPSGSSDLHAVLRDNSFVRARYLVYLDEILGNGFLLDADFDAISGGANRLLGDLTYAVYLQNCDDPVTMAGTYWGTQDPSSIAARIHDGNDQVGLGLVDASQPAAPGPELRVAAMHRSPGYPTWILVTGEPGDPVKIGANQNTGSWVTPYGTLDLPKQGTRTILQDDIEANGMLLREIAANPGAPGTWYLQGVVFGATSRITDLAQVDLIEPR